MHVLAARMLIIQHAYGNYSQAALGLTAAPPRPRAMTSENYRFPLHNEELLCRNASPQRQSGPGCYCALNQYQFGGKCLTANTERGTVSMSIIMPGTWP